jgi:hypothetical protein
VADGGSAGVLGSAIFGTHFRKGQICKLFLPESGCGPTLPTCALQQVVGYLRYTGRDANIVEEAALDPKPPSTVRSDFHRAE